MLYSNRVRVAVLIGAIIAIAGIDLAIMASKLPAWIGIILFIIGALIILYAFDYLSIEKIRRRLSFGKTGDQVEVDFLSRKIVNWFSRDGELIWYFALFGAMILSTVVLYNLVWSPNSEIGSYDLVFILLGIGLVVYPFIWKRYPQESDFILFFLAIIVLEVIPAYLILGPDPTTSQSVSGDLYVQYMLSAPLVFLLNLTGIPSHSDGNIIYFMDSNGAELSVGIAISCSGLYSVMIFLAAFTAFIFSFQKKWNRGTAILLVFGVFVAYLANILRMYIIIIAGHFNGIGNSSTPFTLLWTHEYAGEVIFICWIAIFWWIAFKYLSPKDDGDTDKVKNDAEIEDLEKGNVQ